MNEERIEGTELISKHKEHEIYAYNVYKRRYREKNVIWLPFIKTPYIIDLPTQIKKALPDFYIKNNGGFYIETKDWADDKYSNQSFDAIQFGILKSFVIDSNWREKVFSIWKNYIMGIGINPKIYYDIIDRNNGIIQRYELYKLNPSQVALGSRWDKSQMDAWNKLFETFNFCFSVDRMFLTQTKTGSDEPFFLVGKKTIMEDWENIPLVSIKRTIFEMLKQEKVTFSTREKAKQRIEMLVSDSQGNVERAKNITKNYIKERK